MYALRLPAGLPPWIYGLVIVLMITTVVSAAAVRISRNLSPQDSPDRLAVFTRWLAYRRWARSHRTGAVATAAHTAPRRGPVCGSPATSTLRACRCRAASKGPRSYDSRYGR